MNITDIFSNFYTSAKTNVGSIPAYAGSIFQFRQVPGLPISWLELILVVISCVVLALVIVGNPLSSAPTSEPFVGGGGGSRRRYRN